MPADPGQAQGKGSCLVTFNTEPAASIEPGTVIAKLRRGILWAGGIMIGLGLLALFLPLFSSLVIDILIGWFLTVSGCVVVAGAFSLRGTGAFLWQLFTGLLTLVAGLFLFIFPQQGLVALTLIVAVVFLATGITQFAFALWIRPAPGWKWAIGSATVSILLGGAILTVLPEASGIMLGLLVGIDLVSTGLAMVVLARSIPRGFDR